MLTNKLLSKGLNVLEKDLGFINQLAGRYGSIIFPTENYLNLNTFIKTSLFQLMFNQNNFYINKFVVDCSFV